MASQQIDTNGSCSSCSHEVNEVDTVQCFECKLVFHAVCEEAVSPYCTNKSWLSTFKKLKRSNFLFLCDLCLTRKENNQASTINDQISSLTETVNTLVKEFSTFKNQSTDIPNTEEKEQSWSNAKRVARMKTSLCIKSKGAPVNLEKVEEIVAANSIQVSKTVVKDNGDVYVELPSLENREKLTPLLSEEAFAGNEVVNVKSKLPSISVLNVKQFTSKEEFIEKVKLQNPTIKDLLDNGSEFSIVFAKEPREDAKNHRQKFHQVVARVSEDVRQAIKKNNDKLYIDLCAHNVVDRFFVKRCNKCQNFGHYEKDCQKQACCGYCKGNHLSKDCKDVQEGDSANYKCINCDRGGKESTGHSTHWHKCPTYMELQKKVKKSISYYPKS